MTLSAAACLNSLQSLSDDVLASSLNRLAFFRGSLTPKILIVGEAPGPEENERGMPFVGPSGKLVGWLLSEVGLCESDVAFLNSVFRMPPSDDGSFRSPTSDEISSYRPLVNQIREALQPTITVLLGNTACESILNKRGVARLRDRFFDEFIVTFHPSYVLRNPEKRYLMQQDFKSLAERLRKRQPEPKKFIDIIATEEKKGVQLSMSTTQIISRLREIEPEMANELVYIHNYVATDQKASVSRARSLLEMIVTRLASPVANDNLVERINTIPNLPKQIATQMHYIRKNGNTASHYDESIDRFTAETSFKMLVEIIQWHFGFEMPAETDQSDAVSGDILPCEGSKKRVSEEAVGTSSTAKSVPLRVRFFIADAVHRTWPKIAVLTPDGVLYSEYLAYMKPIVFRKEGFDFDSFKEQDFSFGSEEHGFGYQALREVTFEQACEFQLMRQENWVRRHVSSLRSK